MLGVGAHLVIDEFWIVMETLDDLAAIPPPISLRTNSQTMASANQIVA
jgi:hypothetical protein